MGLDPKFKSHNPRENGGDNAYAAFLLTQYAINFDTWYKTYRFDGRCFIHKFKFDRVSLLNEEK